MVGGSYERMKYMEECSFGGGCGLNRVEVKFLNGLLGVLSVISWVEV